MMEYTVGFSQEPESNAQVVLKIDYATITMSSDMARWIAADLEMWADRVDDRNCGYDEGDDEDDE